MTLATTGKKTLAIDTGTVRRVKLWWGHATDR